MPNCRNGVVGRQGFNRVEGRQILKVFLGQVEVEVRRKNEHSVERLKLMGR